MSIRYAAAFFLMGLSLAISSILLADQSRWSLCLLFPATTFLLLGIVYVGAGPSWLGKRPHGRRLWSGIAWSLPYSLLNELAWWLATARGPAIGHLNENLYFGRRLLRRDQDRLDIPQFHGCLDLTAEFSETTFLRGLPSYRSLPILDGTAPTMDQLRDAVDWLNKATSQGPVYVHCALGHGRTGTVVIAFLVSSGLESDIESALKRLQKARPGLNINAAQRKRLTEFLEEVRRHSGLLLRKAAADGGDLGDENL